MSSMSSHRDRFNALCEQICADDGWELLPNGIRVSWGSGRHQLVALQFIEHEGRELARFSTRIGVVEQLDEERLLMALRVNAGLPHGALAVMHDDLVMIDTQIVQDADPEEVRASIDYLARAADSYEKSLFGTDTY